MFNKETQGNKYVIRIYDLDGVEPPYVAFGADSVDCMPIIIAFATSKNELLKRWLELLKNYEGYVYSVYDMKLDNCIVGGIFDPSDDDIINENVI